MEIIVSWHAIDRVMERVFHIKKETITNPEEYLKEKLVKYLSKNKYKKGETRDWKLFVAWRFHKIIYEEVENGFYIITYWNRQTTRGDRAKKTFNRIENLFWLNYNHYEKNRKG